MAVIDSHVHLYPDFINADPVAWARGNGEPLWETLCTRVRKNGVAVQGFPGVSTLLQEMDTAGIERAVLLGWYWENPDNCRLQNDFYHACLLAHPDRFRAFAALHPGLGQEGLRSEVARAVERGFSGFGELSPHSQGIPVSGEAWRGLMELVSATGLLVNFHVTEPEAGAYAGKVETPLTDFLTLATAYPKTRFILSHLGARLPVRFPEARGLDNLYYDLAAAPLLYDLETVEAFVEEAGPGRVLFGTDYPLNLYPRLSPVPTLTEFTQRVAREFGDKHAVLAQNARALGL